MDVEMLLLRLVVGGLMVGHGTQKLFGWFGGNGVRGTAGWLQSMGFRPATPLAVMTGASEAGGGLLLMLGLLTPLSAAAIGGILLTAIATVHWGKGMWSSNGGGELPLTLATSALATAFIGPGRFSVDSALGLDIWGTAWGLGALGLAVVTAGATLLSRSILVRRAASACEGDVVGEMKEAA